MMTALPSMARRVRPATVGAVLFTGFVLAIGGWIYWPGISGPELLDDRSSVLVIDDLRSRPELAFDYIFGDKSGTLGRSIRPRTASSSGGISNPLVASASDQLCPGDSRTSPVARNALALAASRSDKSVITIFS